MVKGAQLSSATVRCQRESCNVVATVETPELFEPVLVQAIQNVLEARMSRTVELIIRSVQMSEASAAGYRFVARQPPVPDEPGQPAEVSREERIRQLLAEQARMVPGAKLVDFSFDAATQPPKVLATNMVKAPFEPPLEQGIANLLRSNLGEEIELRIQYVGPLGAPAPEAAEPPPS